MKTFREFLLNEHSKGGGRLEKLHHAFATIYGLGKPKHEHKPGSHKKREKMGAITKEKIEMNREKIERLEQRIEPYEKRIKVLRAINRKLRGDK